MRLLTDANPAAASRGLSVQPMRIVLSFDVEEHYRIEAAASLAIDSGLKAHYSSRLEPSIRWLLAQLEEREIKATFFVVGQLAQHNPGLVRAISQAGHEVASHSWDHQRVHRLTPAAFREDVLQSKDILEQLTGVPVAGYRAPTFSIMAQTAWALDVLAELGMAYDSSIFPVRHDRYGVPNAPRAPFLAQGDRHCILELPPATLRLLGVNLPTGGGGYFRLLPPFLIDRTLRQVERRCSPSVATLYFHPWEFDADQAWLPLSRWSRFRTYVGINGNRERLTALLGKYEFVRAIDVAKQLDSHRDMLPCFRLVS